MRENAFFRALRLVRGQDWWEYKIPPLLACGYASALISNPEPARALTSLGALLASISFAAGYGYLVNDSLDIEDDRRSGKPNVMAGKPAWAAIALCAAAAAGSFLPLLLFAREPVLFILLSVNLLLPTLYSIPPVRLKNRGIWGALADAGAARAVPAASMAAGVALPAGVSAVLLTGAVGFGFFSGFRGIIAHQVRDSEADASAGVSTFARRIGPQRARALVLRWILPFEIACAAAFFFAVVTAAPVVIPATAVWLILECWKWKRGWKLPQFEAPDSSRERYVPLVNNEYYELWLPLALAVQLAITRVEYLPLPIFQVAAFLPNLRARWAALLPLFRPRRTELAGVSRPAPRGRRPEVIVGATYWTVNGVNVFSMNLVRGLNAAGIPAQILLTEENTDLISVEESPLPRPPDIPFVHLPVQPWDGWGAHWGALIRFLESRAPCIYIPNSDWRHSCVAPLLPDSVVILGIVHSDDPLHYDHVRRLGKYWNAVVAVSSATREKTLRECPSLAARTVTIPIGVDVPSKMPERNATDGPLRVIYHGILKQHQKRVLDLPRIIAAALGEGVPIELSIAGSGPNERELRQAAQPLVERGAIRFLGVLGHDTLGRVLEGHDVFLLPSEFEGMPNALIEAMARGCVPVVSRMASGIPELVRDGENGYLAAFGDPSAFAKRLKELWRDPDARRRMSAAAYQTVASGNYSARVMVRSYIEVFERSCDEAAQRKFARPRALLEPVPATVAGVSIFPVPCTHEEPEVGAFPSAADAADFLRMRNGATARGRPAAAGRAARRLRGVEVIVASPIWARNGISIFSEDLVRGLRREGVASRLLLTEEHTRLVRISDPRLARPTDIPVDKLTVRALDSWGRRWGAMQRYLENHAPCIYIPNYDWRHSCVIPRVPDDVCAVAVVHRHDAFYLDQVRRLEPYWNAVVATSRSIEDWMRSCIPGLAPRLHTIPCGADVPDTCPADRTLRGGLRVLVARGSDSAGPVPVSTAQLAAIAEAGGASIRFTCIRGSVPGDNISPTATWIDEPSRLDWLRLYDRHDVLLTSFDSGEDLRRLKEAMGRGCVPVLAGGDLPDIVVNEHSGFWLPGAAAPELTSVLAHFAGDERLRRAIVTAAYRRARRGAPRTSDMVWAYAALFEKLRSEVAARRYCRPNGPIVPPPAYIDGVGIFPIPLQHVVPELGAFPSEDDFRAYRKELPRGRTRPQ